MKTTEQALSKLQLQDEITETLEKAKAIVHLMPIAAVDKAMEHDSEILWAEHIHRDLIEEAARLINLLAGIKEEVA